MRTILVSSLVALSFGCSNEWQSNPSPQERLVPEAEEPAAPSAPVAPIAEEISRAAQQHVVWADDDHVEFYVGHAVREALRNQIEFKPGPTDQYGIIRVPTRMIPRFGLGPVTWSLCDPRADVSVEYHRYLGPEEAALAKDPTSRILTYTDEGEELERFNGGDPGIFGQVQVSWTVSGELVAGVSAQYLIQWGDRPELTRNGGMSIGALDEDDSLEDPLLRAGGCVCNKPGC